MKLHSYLFILFTLIFISSEAKLIMTSHEKGAHEYWLIYDNERPTKESLVVFLHGYGASNPGCYGGWIKSLTSEGNVVLFPKFQIGTFLPRTRAFQKRTAYVINHATELLQKQHHVSVESLVLVGHSIGGVIAANLANDHTENGFNVSGMVLCQPGFKYLKLGGYNSYSHTDPGTHILIITGENDNAAGKKFASKVYESVAISEEKKAWLEHREFKTDDIQLSAHHKDPVSPLKELDANNINLVIGGAFMICKTDLVDELAFWEPSRQFLSGLNQNMEQLTVPATLPDWVVQLD